MDIQRLRNLTTGILHTKMGDIYEDLEWITGEPGIMTHMIPRAMKAVEPWLRENVNEARFWDGKFDTTHIGDFELKPMSKDESKDMFARYIKMPNPLEGKKVISVVAS